MSEDRPMGMYDCLRLRHFEYKSWQLRLRGFLPRSYRLEDDPHESRNPSYDEMVSGLADFYIARDLGPAYCFLNPAAKKRRLNSFMRRHFREASGGPDAAKINAIRDCAMITVSGKTLVSPSELRDLWKSYANARFKKGVVSMMYRNAPDTLYFKENEEEMVDSINREIPHIPVGEIHKKNQMKLF